MAFPINGILDNFNRADSGPPLSASWTLKSGTGMKVISNQGGVNASGVTQIETYNVANYGEDCEVFITLPVATVWDPILLYLKYDTVLKNGYAVRLTGVGNTIRLRRYDNDVITDYSSIAQTISNGDSFGASYIQGTLKSYYKPSAGSWTVIDTVVDTKYINTVGRFGINCFDAGTTGRFDDFGGGTIGKTLAWIKA